MKVQYKIEDEKPLLVLKYSETEWEALKKKFEQLKLKVSKTQDGLGNGLNSFRYYRSTKNEFSNSLGLDDTIDNINANVIWNGLFNVGIFRFLPDENLELKCKLSGFLSEDECKKVKNSILKFFERFVKFGSEWEMERITTNEEEQSLTEFINNLDVNLGGRNVNNS